MKLYKREEATAIIISKFEEVVSALGKSRKVETHVNERGVINVAVITRIDDHFVDIEFRSAPKSGCFMSDPTRYYPAIRFNQYYDRPVTCTKLSLSNIMPRIKIALELAVKREARVGKALEEVKRREACFGRARDLLGVDDSCEYLMSVEAGTVKICNEHRVKLKAELTPEELVAVNSLLIEMRGKTNG